jgi:hypothetical protein
MATPSPTMPRATIAMGVSNPVRAKAPTRPIAPRANINGPAAAAAAVRPMPILRVAGLVAASDLNESASCSAPAVIEGAITSNSVFRSDFHAASSRRKLSGIH